MNNAIAQKRIVFHAVNQIGLGHLSRLSAIAQAVRTRAPHVSLMFMVEGGSHGLLEAAGLPYFGLSFSPAKAGPGAVSRQEAAEVMRGFAEVALAATRPDLLVFDSIPNALLVAAAKRRGTRLALCLRKMKDEHANWIRGLMGVFDLVLIPHQAGEMTVPDGFSKKTHFVGTIVRPLSVASVPNPPDIVISGGGGGYPGTVRFYNGALAAFAELRRVVPEVSGLLVTGPLFAEWAQLRPVDGVQILPYDPELTSTFASGRLVVCQGGYNTMAEVIALKVPAICVPAARVFDDQVERVIGLAKVSPQIQLCEEGNVPAMAAKMREGLLMKRLAVDDGEAPRGAAIAAQHLLSALET